MSNIYSFSDEVTTPIIDLEIKKQTDIIKSEIWYHGEIERTLAEDRIINNGEFLLRLSGDEMKNFVVTTRWNGEFMHVIVKTDVDNLNHQLVYYIDPSWKFSTILELIHFHNKQQHPLSKDTGAVLYRPVNKNRPYQSPLNGMLSLPRESRYRKSSQVLRRNNNATSTLMPSHRTGSETDLNTNNRFSVGNGIMNMNKSLTDLSHSVVESSKPVKPSVKSLKSKFLSIKLRPNLKIRNKKLYTESSDYTDWSQLNDTESALERERIRRGLSHNEVKRTTLEFETISTNKKKNNSLYSHSVSTNDAQATYVSCDNLSTPTNMTDSQFNVYGLPEEQNTAPIKFGVSTQKSMTTVNKQLKTSIYLKPFINYALSDIYLSCCGSILKNGFDKSSINRVTGFLLSKADNYQKFCKHLLDELRLIFIKSSDAFDDMNLGYRSIFLQKSKDFVEDLKIRQEILSRFVIATVLSTQSIDKRGKMILFWLRCAEYMQLTIKDLYHFRSIMNAINSQRIIELSVWQTLYQQSSTNGLQARMEGIRFALADGELLSTCDIFNYIPDLPDIHNQFFNDSNITSNSDINSQLVYAEQIWKLGAIIMNWTTSEQSFKSSDCWINKIFKKLQSQCVDIPFLKELVKTETMLSMLVGHRDIARESIFLTDIDFILKRMSNENRDTTT